MANFTSKLSNLCCFYAFYVAFVLTNFCWCGRCGFEAWLNFTRVASRPLFFRAFYRNFVKRADMAANGGVARLLKVFAVEQFCLIARVVRRDYLAMKKFSANALRVRNFHSTCNFDIVRLNNEVLLPTEQLLNLTNQTTKSFIFGKR